MRPRSVRYMLIDRSRGSVHGICVFLVVGANGARESEELSIQDGMGAFGDV